MGADRPELKKSETPTQSYFPLVVIGAATMLLVVALVLTFNFTNEQPIPGLNPKDKARLEKRLKEIDDSEQYALVAIIEGLYPCLHSGRTTCYLRVGEVWKYGVTSKGEFGRYASGFLSGHNVSYIVQFKGNFSECLKQEQIKLFNYPSLPENVARPPADRLPRPPYNPITR